MVRSKKDLAYILSSLKVFDEASWKLEQYAISGEIAATWIWEMALRGEVAGKIILDAASGTGILGLGLLLMGAKKVYFVDIDVKAMHVCEENYQKLVQEYEIGEASFIVSDISLFDEVVDVVVQNPPFGTKEEHADKKFLEKAFASATLVYSMHKYSTKRFIEAISKDFHFRISDVWQFSFPIKARFAFHEKPVKKIDVGLWRMEKERD